MTNQTNECFDHPINTKKGDKTKRYKACYNQKAVRISAAVRERSATAQCSVKSSHSAAPDREKMRVSKR